MEKDGNVDFKDGIFTFINSRLRVTGKSILSLPDYNFKIELKFKTIQANCGLFSFQYNGHDRHFFLKAGKPNHRVWKGGRWSVDNITSLNDNEWHHWVLTCKTGEGQKMIIDGKQVGTNNFDHSDFDWKERFYLGYSADDGSKFTGSIKDLLISNLTNGAQGGSGSITHKKMGDKRAGQHTHLQSEKVAKDLGGTLVACQEAKDYIKKMGALMEHQGSWTATKEHDG